jgi:hypothetical protein
VRHLRSVCCSVLFGGGGGRDDIAACGRRLHFRNRSDFGGSRCWRGSLFGSLGALDLSYRSRCTVRVLFFGSRRRCVIGSTSLVAGSAGGFALFPCSSFGTSGGDKWNTGIAIQFPSAMNRG